MIWKPSVGRISFTFDVEQYLRVNKSFYILPLIVEIVHRHIVSKYGRKIGKEPQLLYSTLKPFGHMSSSQCDL